MQQLTMEIPAKRLAMIRRWEWLFLVLTLSLFIVDLRALLTVNPGSSPSNFPGNLAISLVMVASSVSSLINNARLKMVSVVLSFLFLTTSLWFLRWP
jgi:hypothetical protein